MSPTPPHRHLCCPRCVWGTVAVLLPTTAPRGWEGQGVRGSRVSPSRREQSLSCSVRARPGRGDRHVSALQPDTGCEVLGRPGVVCVRGVGARAAIVDHTGVAGPAVGPGRVFVTWVVTRNHRRRDENVHAGGSWGPCLALGGGPVLLNVCSPFSSESHSQPRGADLLPTFLLRVRQS